MPNRRAPLTALLLGLLAVHAKADAPRLQDLATSRIDDLQVTATVVKADQAALRKISRDFGMTYLLKEVVLSYKEPNKLRMESSIGFYVVNGSARFFRVPQLNLKKRDDLGTSPGKRYSLLEIGLLPRSLLAVAAYRHLRDETLAGLPVHVFEITYRGDPTSRNVVWIDPRTRLIVRREWHNGEGELKAVFTYQNPREVLPGLWIPTRIELRNADGVVAGITDYANVKVNQGLADSLFDVAS